MMFSKGMHSGAISMRFAYIVRVGMENVSLSKEIVWEREFPHDLMGYEGSRRTCLAYQ